MYLLLISLSMGISASGGSSLPSLPARSVLENVGPYRCNRNSAISERKSCSLPYGYTPGTRSGCKHRDAPPGDYFNGILNTDLPLNEPNIRYVTHQSKWRDLRTLIEKVFRFFLLINH